MANTVTTYYAQTSAIDELVREYGPRLEQMEVEDKLFMIQGISACMDYRDGEEYLSGAEAMEDVLQMIDADGFRPEELWEALRLIADEDNQTLLGLMEAMVNQMKVQYRSR